MQTIAVFTAPTGGIITINGRFAGETGPDSPLMLPVTPNGILYVKFSPFLRRFRPTAHKFRISGGKFDTECADDTCYMMLWPGGICEFAITSPAAYPPESEYTMIDAKPVALLRGEAALLRVGGNSIALPAGAQLPDSHFVMNGAEIYTGPCPEGRYAALFSSHELRPIDSVVATTIEPEENGMLRTGTKLGDTVGHMLIETCRPSENALNIISSEYMWSEGAPKWPDSPEMTALAAAEAALLGLDGEARAYLAPAARQAHILTDLARQYDMAMPMKYAPPGPVPAIALVKKLSGRAAQVVPLRYHAVPSAGTQGPWQLDRLELD